MENKKARKYAVKLTRRKVLSSSHGYTNFKGKKMPLPLPLIELEKQ